MDRVSRSLRPFFLGIAGGVRREPARWRCLSAGAYRADRRRSLRCGDRVADLDAVIIDREAEPAGEARREDGAQRQRVGGFLLEVEIAAVGAEDIAPRLLILLVERSEEHTSELQSI